MTNATDLAKRLREWASRLDDACGPHESLVLLDSSADLLESQAARIAELERERDEALLLVEGPGTLRELANEYGRAMMSEAELLARERRVRQALKNIDGIMPRDTTAQLILRIILDALAAVGVDGAATRQTD